MQINNITIISPAGKIDQPGGQQLDEYLKNLVSRGNIKLILDFRNVDFTGTGGLKVLLGTIKYTRSQGGDIFLVNVSPVVNNILITTGFSNLLTIYTDIDSALMNIEMT
jgi:anti-sigma B factor antagonist